MRPTVYSINELYVLIIAVDLSSKANTKSSISVLVWKYNAFDMDVARRLGEFPHTYIVELETGHNTFPYLKDVGKLGAPLEAFVEGQDIRSIVAGV